MATAREYQEQPLALRLERLRRTPAELAAAIEGRTDAELARRPDGRSWSATEVLCHLRDIEELFVIRFHTMLAAEDPTFLVVGEVPADRARWGIGGAVPPPLDADRWAEERQYARSDGRRALAALRRRREELLALLGGLSPAQWQRGGIHITHGRMTFPEWVALLCGHDDNHLGQLRRALAGHP